MTVPKQMTILLALMLGFLLQANAVNKTWTNGGGTNNWSDAANWSGGVPGAADVALFTSTYTANCNINTQVNINSITIQAGYTGTITQMAGDSIVLSTAFSQAAGTFIGGDKRIDDNGTFTLTGGSFTSTTGNLYVQNNLTISTGVVFNANNGSLYFDQAGTTTVTLPTNGSIQFYNVVFNSSVGSTITAGDTMVVTGTLSLLQNQVKTGIIRLVSGSSFVTNSAFTGGNGVLDIQAPLTITPLGSAFCGVNVNNASAVFNAPAFALTINGVLTVSNGTFNGGTNTVTVNGAFKQTGGTYNASTGNNNFDAGFTYTAGTFNNNSGTTAFTSATSGTFTTGGKVTLYDVNVNKSTAATTFTMAATDTLKCTHSLTLTMGTMNGGYMNPQCDNLTITANYNGGSSILLLNTANTLTIPTTYKVPGMTINNASAIVNLTTGVSPVFQGTVTLKNGTFNCNASKWLMAQALSITGGTFNASSDTIQYNNAAITISTGATFNHNNGTFSFMRSAGATTITNTLKTLFYNLIVNLTNATASNAKLTVATNDTIVAVNSLTLAAGNLAGIIELRGSLNDLGVMTASTGTLLIANGSGSRNINLVSAFQPGIQLIDANVSLNAPTGNTLTIGAAFTLKSGDFFPDAYNIIVTGAYNQSGGNFWNGTANVNFNSTFTLSSGNFYPTDGITTIVGAYSQTGGTFQNGNGIINMSSTFTMSVGDFYPPNSAMTITSTFTQTTGVFHAGTARQTYNGTVAINGGTFTATSDTTVIGNASLTVGSSGTFVHNNGTFNFSRNAGGITVVNTKKQSFYNIIINLTNATAASARFTETAADTIIALNTLTLQAGNIYTGGLVEVRGSLVDLGSFGGGIGTLLIANGTGSRTLSFTSANIPGLNINDINVTVNATTSAAATINGIFTLVKGTFNPGSYTTTYTGAFTQSGGTFATGSTKEVITGAVSLTGGTFNCSSDTTEFDGATVTLGAVTFNHNNGTVSFASTTGNQSFTPNALAFNVYNLYVNLTNVTNKTLTILTVDTVIVNNNLALVQGLANSGMVKVVSNIKTISTFNGGTALIIFAGGTGARTINLPGATWPNLTINDANLTVNGPSSGTCALQGNLTIQKGTFTGGAGSVSVTGNYTQSGGTFSGNAGDLSITGNYAISGAGTVFTAPAGTLTVAGTFTITSPAAFNHNNGTLQFTGIANKTLTSAAALTLNNLTVSLTGNAQLRPNFSLTLNGNLTIGAGAVLNQTISNIDLTIAGNFNDQNAGGGLIYGTRTVTFNGASAQTITSATAPLNLYNLAVSNTSGGVGLNNDVYVNNILTLTASTGAKVILGSSNLTISPTGSISGGTANEFVVTGGAGSLRQEGIGPALRSGSITFPVGISSSRYTPVTLKNTGTADRFDVRVVDKVLSNGTSGSPIYAFALSQTYFVEEQTVGGSNVNLTLQWNATDEMQGFDRTLCHMTHYYNNYWNQEGSMGPATGSGPYSQTVSGITTFSPFDEGSGGGELPIELMSFTGSENGAGKVDLKWSTQIEVNNNYFTIERSDDGVNYSELTRVNGAGNSTMERDYTWTDENPLQGTGYYRLKQTDFDQKFQYVGEVAVSITKNTATPSISLFPNPLVGRELQLSMIDNAQEALSTASVNVTDLTGKKIYTGVMGASASTNISLPASMAQGMYLVEVISNGKTYQHKLLVR